MLLLCAWSLQAQLSHDAPGETRKPDRTVTAGSGKVYSVAYSPNGNLLAAGGEDKLIRIWDANTGGLRLSLGGHSAPVRSVAFSPDGKSLASASLDGTVRILNVGSGNFERSLDAPAARGMAFQPGAEPVLAVSGQDKVRLWNFAAGRLMKTLERGGMKIEPLAFQPDGKILVTGGSDGSVRLWNMTSGALIRAVDAGSPVSSVAASGGYVAFGCEDGKVKLLSPEGAETELGGAGAAVHAVAFSVDGAQLAAGGANGAIRIWDTKSGRFLMSLEGHTDAVLALAFSPNGRSLASGGADGTVRRWTQPLPPVPAEDARKIEAALPAKAAVPPKKPRKLLVFWRADAIQHKIGVAYANRTIELLAKKTGAFQVDFSRDYEVLDPKTLAQYDAIVMNSTAHLAIPGEAQKKALLDFVWGGGGVVGIHAAIGTFKDWPEGAEIIGATFGGHPWVPTGRWSVKLEEPDHPLLRAFAGKGFAMNDEFYELDTPYTRSDRRVLMSLDLSDAATAGVQPVHRQDRDFAVSWVKRYGQGRVFYGMFGHTGAPFEDAAVVRFYLDGIQYALGDLEAVDRPGK